MYILSKNDLNMASGGQCTGSGNSNGIGVSCTATLFENKNRKVDVTVAGDSRRGVTNTHVQLSIKFP